MQAPQMSLCSRRSSFATGTECRAVRPQQKNLRQVRTLAVGATADVAKTRLVEFHVGETTISLPLESDRIQQLDAAMTQLLQTFAAKQKAERPKRWDLLEVRFKGEQQDELEFFELVCNPNAYTTAFEAKMLITVRTRGGMKVATEARLSSVKADIDTCMPAK